MNSVSCLNSANKDYSYRVALNTNFLNCFFTNHFRYRKGQLTILTHLSVKPGSVLNIKTVFPGMGIRMLTIRPLWDSLIFNRGIRILVRHLYIETPPPPPPPPPRLRFQFIWACVSCKKNILHILDQCQQMLTCSKVISCIEHQNSLICCKRTYSKMKLLWCQYWGEE